jgi:hypothetical protein
MDVDIKMDGLNWDVYIGVQKKHTKKFKPKYIAVLV